MILFLVSLLASEIVLVYVSIAFKGTWIGFGSLGAALLLLVIAFLALYPTS